MCTVEMKYYLMVQIYGVLVDNTSLSHADNRKNNFLVLRKGPT